MLKFDQSRALAVSGGANYGFQAKRWVGHVYASFKPFNDLSYTVTHYGARGRVMESKAPERVGGAYNPGRSTRSRKMFAGRLFASVIGCPCYHCCSCSLAGGHCGSSVHFPNLDSLRCRETREAKGGMMAAAALECLTAVENVGKDLHVTMTPTAFCNVTTRERLTIDVTAFNTPTWRSGRLLSGGIRTCVRSNVDGRNRSCARNALGATREDVQSLGRPSSQMIARDLQLRKRIFGSNRTLSRGRELRVTKHTQSNTHTSDAHRNTNSNPSNPSMPPFRSAHARSFSMQRSTNQAVQFCRCSGTYLEGISEEAVSSQKQPMASCCRLRSHARAVAGERGVFQAHRSIAAFLVLCDGFDVGVATRCAC